MDVLDRVTTGGLSRRSLLRLMLGVGAVAATGRLGGGAGAAGGPGTYRTTGALNLRAGSSTSHKVLLVLPAGATVVDYDGVLANGFRSVDYRGTVGWAFDAYLVPAGSPSKPVIVGTAKTTAAVNLRAGPSTGDKVLRVVPAGTWVQIGDTVQNGFRYAVDDGLAGWIYDAYLGGADAGAFTTTAALNLRAGPGTSHKVLLVLPAGATVVDYDGVLANGFRSVDYRGTVGWAFDAYLA